jgi:hypothetical protein
VGFVVRLSREERAALEALAQERGMSASSVLRSLLHGDGRFRALLFQQARMERRKAND